MKTARNEQKEDTLLLNEFEQKLDKLINSAFSPANLLEASNARLEFIKCHAVMGSKASGKLEKRFTEIDYKFDKFIEKIGGLAKFNEIRMKEELMSGDAAANALKYYKQSLLEFEEELEKKKLDILTLSWALDNRENFYIICNKMKELGLDTKKHERNIEPLNNLLKGVIQKIGEKNYLDKLEDYLQNKINSYAYSINHKMYEEVHEFGFDLNERDTIEAILCEIEGKRELDSTLRKELHEADKKFKKVVTKLSKDFNIINEPYYPKKYWWRHLKKNATE